MSQLTDIGTEPADSFAAAEAAPDLRKSRRKKLDTSSVDRLPPNSPEAEKGVLGCVFLSPVECMGICVEKFRRGAEVMFDLRHQELMRVLIAMYDAKEPIDLITVMQKLRDKQLLEGIGGVSYLASLPDCVPSAANIDYYIEIVREKYLLRKVLQTCGGIMSRVYDHEGEVDELLDSVEKEVHAISEERVDNVTVTVRDLVHKAINTIEECHQNKGALTGISTGFADFDRMTFGLHPGDMVIIAARPSLGKTSWSMNVAEHVAIEQKLPVGVFSLEMTSEALIMRMLCSRARVNHRNIRDGFLAERDFPRLTGAAGKISAAPLFIDDTAGLSILQLRAKARRMHQQHGIKLFVIDYMQLLHSTNRRAENRQQEIADISGGIKALAKELNVPIIVLSQLNRDLEKDKSRKPRLSDLRESGCISVETGFVWSPSGSKRNEGKNMELYSKTDSGIEILPSSDIPRGTKPCIRIKLVSGRILDCTSEHPILTDQGFKSASDLTSEDAIACARKINHPNGKRISEAKWIGWMLGNGSLTGKGVPEFCCSCKVVAEAFLSETERIFGFIPKAHPHYVAKEFWQYAITKGKVRVSGGNPCKNWLLSKQLWGRGSKERRIPDWFMESADEDSIANLLSGLLETDGSVHSGGVEISTTSLEMAYQILWLFSRIGIFANLDNGYESEKATTHCYKISLSSKQDVQIAKARIPMIGRKGMLLQSYQPSARGPLSNNRLSRKTTSELGMLMKQIGRAENKTGYRLQVGRRMTQKTLERILPIMGSPQKYMWMASPTIHWDRLRSITDIGEKQVFDRSVPKSHNFVVNGILVHNSIEQDSDIVGLLYKPTSEEDEQSQEQEAIAVNLLIAKSRNGPTGDVHLTFLKTFTRFESAAKVSADDVPTDTGNQRGYKQPYRDS